MDFLVALSLPSKNTGLEDSRLGSGLEIIWVPRVLSDEHVEGVERFAQMIRGWWVSSVIDLKAGKQVSRRRHSRLIRRICRLVLGQGLELAQAFDEQLLGLVTASRIDERRGSVQQAGCQGDKKTRGVTLPCRQTLQFSNRNVELVFRFLVFPDFPQQNPRFQTAVAEFERDIVPAGVRTFEINEQICRRSIGRFSFLQISKRAVNVAKTQVGSRSLQFQIHVIALLPREVLEIHDRFEQETLADLLHVGKVFERLTHVGQPDVDGSARISIACQGVVAGRPFFLGQKRVANG